MRITLAILSVALLAITAFSAPASASWTITAGQFIGSSGAGTGESLAGNRFRSFQPTGAEENYLGVPNLGTASNRVAQQLNWMTDANNPLSSFDFTFQYDQANNKLVSTIMNSTISWNNWSTSLVSRGKTKGAADLNAFQISIGNRDTGSNVYLTELVLDGHSLGGFSTSNPSFANWLVTGSSMNLTDGFTLTGKLWLQGAFSSSQENSVVNLTAGWDARGAAPVPEPASALVFATGLAFAGFFRRRRRQAC